MKVERGNYSRIKAESSAINTNKRVMRHNPNIELNRDELHYYFKSSTNIADGQRKSSRTNAKSTSPQPNTTIMRLMRSPEQLPVKTNIQRNMKNEEIILGGEVGKETEAEAYMRRKALSLATNNTNKRVLRPNPNIYN